MRSKDKGQKGRRSPISNGVPDFLPNPCECLLLEVSGLLLCQVNWGWEEKCGFKILRFAPLFCFLRKFSIFPWSQLNQVTDFLIWGDLYLMRVSQDVSLFKVALPISLYFCTWNLWKTDKRGASLIKGRTGLTRPPITPGPFPPILR